MSTLDDTIQAYVSDQRLTEHKSRRFNTRNNSLNLMRLALAILVIYAHSYPLGGFSGQPRLGGETLGTWAVYGFFCISGYLIAGSRMSNPFGTFLTKRILRIYPAFWACLLATAAIFAPVEYIHENGTIDAFLTTGPVTPINYIMSNISLHIGQWDIGGTLQGVPYPGAWNGSLWTLYFEFACYILVGALLSSRLIRRSPWPLFALFTFSVVLSAQIDPLQVYVGGNGEFGDLAGLLPFFLGGSLVYMLREWLPFRWEGAAIAGIGLLIILPHSSTWASSLAAPLLTYELLWLANTVKIGRASCRERVF